MDSKTLLVKTLSNETKIRKKSTKGFSWVLFFAGDEFNQELEKNERQEKINLIDFEKESNKEGVWIEDKIKEICNNAENKQLLEEKKFPIIWFKNIEKITSGSELEKALLPIFDHQQNTKLFNGKVNLSNYILIATSSTRDMGKLSLPLTSRLECINAETAQPRQFFLDKYFYPILGVSLLVPLMLVLFLIYSDRKETEEKK